MLEGEGEGEGEDMNKTKLDSLWKRYLKKHADEPKRKLVEYYYTHLVMRIARKLCVRFKYHISAEALASYGTEGLYRALKAFNPCMGVKFETYAYARVWGSMIDGIRKEDWVPRSVRNRQTLIEKTQDLLETKMGDRVSKSDVLKIVGIKEEDYHKNSAKFHAVSCSSIETNINSDIDNSDNRKDFNSSLVAHNISSPDSRIVRKEFFNKLIGKNFTPLERKIIYYYYYENLTMKEISAHLDISESRISQINQNILQRLKTRVKVNPLYFGKEIIEMINMCNDKSSLV